MSSDTIIFYPNKKELTQHAEKQYTYAVHFLHCRVEEGAMPMGIGVEGDGRMHPEDKFQEEEDSPPQEVHTEQNHLRLDRTSGPHKLSISTSKSVERERERASEREE